jgi:hypothetical protein
MFHANVKIWSSRAWTRYTMETLFQQNIWKLRLQLNRPGMIMAKKLNN